MEKQNYKHKIVEKVRFHEVDMLSVCNNAVYFNYFEDARIKYTQDLKKNYQLKELLEGNSFFIMVHNEADYHTPAFMDDELYVHTRIDFIKNSSFGFRHLVERISTGEIIAKGGGVVVHIDRSNNRPVPLPNEFYEAVKNFENEVKIERK